MLKLPAKTTGFTFIYVGFIFFFTIKGSEIASFLQQRNLLETLIFSLFFSCVAVTLVYLIKKIKNQDILSIFLLILLFIFCYCVIKNISFSVEKIHFIEFGLLTLLIRKDLAKINSVLFQYAGAVLLTGLIGLMDEALQNIMPSRVFDWRDVNLNFVSAITTITGYELLENRLRLFRLKRKAAGKGKNFV